MHKRLLLVLAVLITPVFLYACAEHEAGQKVDPKVLAATVEKASNLADSLDKMVLKAYGMGQVGASMAAVDPAGAAQEMDQALTVAKEALSPANKAELEGLKAATSGWGPAEMEQVAPLISRIENATSRVWVIRTIAEGIAPTNKVKAMGILAEAAALAEAIPDRNYRDLDIRGVAAAMSGMDASAAAAVAGKIADPRTKAWALTAVGSEAAKSSPAGAGVILDAAAEAARAIKGMAPSSELINDETRPETKEKLLAADKAKLVAASAKAMSKVALAMEGVDKAKAASLFKEAADTANSVEGPYTKAYALSDVAMDMAEADPAGAADLAAKIKAGHEDAMFAALMKAAKVRAKASGKASGSDLDAAETAAKKIADEYDRAKALSEVGMALVSVSNEKALDIAKELDEMQAPGYEKEGGRHSMQADQIRAAVAVDIAKADQEKASEELKKIVEPRFNKKAVMYVKACALMEMAANRAATDADAAKKLYGKAVGAAADAGSAPLQWKAAAGLCALDKDKLFETASKIESDNYTKAMGLAAIASEWSSKGEANAGMVWDMAVKAAAGMDDDYASADALRSIASRCAQYDKARAAAIFARAAEKVGNIGKAKA